VSEDVADGVELNRPGAQFVHGVPPVEYEPSSQLVQALSEVAPVVELAFPAAQGRQVAEGEEL